MIERLILLALIVAGVLAVGSLVRAYGRRQQSAAIGRIFIEPSGERAPRILSFYGPACNACDRQKRVLSELQAERHGLFVEWRDATVDYDLARTYGLLVVPMTIVLAANGAVAGINSGFTARPVLEAQLDAA